MKKNDFILRVKKIISGKKDLSFTAPLESSDACIWDTQSMVAILILFQETFGINNIAIDDVEKMKTIKDMYNYYLEHGGATND